MKKMTSLALALLGSLVATAAVAGQCTEEIRKLEESAKATDAKNSPGSQETPTTPDGKPSAAAPGPENGGTKSASAKILEAKARDQRKDEPGCMEAIGDAKKFIRS